MDKILTFSDYQYRSVYEGNNPGYKGGNKGKKPEKDRININTGVISSLNGPFRSYMACFSEALSSLDSMNSLALAIDPNSKVVNDYNKNRKSIGTSVEKNEAGISKAWAKLIEIAGQGDESGLTSVIPKLIKQKDVTKKYYDAEAELDSRRENMDDAIYKKELDAIKKKYSGMLSPYNIIWLTKTAEAIGLYRSAIDKFKEGANQEIKYVTNKKSEADTEGFFGRIGDAMESMVLSSKYAVKNGKSFESEEYDIYEDSFGGFLNTNKGFFKDVAKGIKTAVIGKKEDNGKADAYSLVKLADNLKGSLLSASSAIENVINFKSNIYGISKDDGINDAKRNAAKKSADSARGAASEMISFIENSFKYVLGVEDAVKTEPLKPIEERLNKIANNIDIITRSGGSLDTWKNEVMGAERENVASSAYLEKGRELMSMAAEKANSAIDDAKLEKSARSFDLDELIKKLMGKKEDNKKTDKIERIRKKSDVNTFKLNSTDSDTIKDYQRRLIKMGYLPNGGDSGKYDDPTKKASRTAMGFLPFWTSKSYSDVNDNQFEDFQRDFGFYSDNTQEVLTTLKS